MSKTNGSAGPASSWTWYWTNPESAAACVPQASETVQTLISDRWCRLGESLPENAKVIDMACGVGAACRAIQSGGTTLSVVGVDYAEMPAEVTSPFKVYAGVALEELPFENATFDCAISQFGFEYASLGACEELTRVLKPGGNARLLMHHSQSVIVAANMERSAVLQRIAEFKASDAVRSSDRARLQVGFGNLINQFGEQSLIMEIATACRDALSMPPTERDQLLDKIDDGMKRELSILAELESAALSPDQLQVIVDRTRDAIDWQSPAVIQHDGELICWELNGTKGST